MLKVQGVKLGVYRDWIEGQGLENIKKWVKLGLSEVQITKNIGVSRTTFRSWLKRFPDFAATVKEARRIPELEVENSMFDLACGRVWVEEIKSVLDPKNGSILKVEKLRRQIPPNPTMLIFLAKNWMSDKYKDYVPVPSANKAEESQPKVEIYLPDNGRDDK